MHALFNIAQIYRKGDVVKQSWERAIEWYRKAAEKKHVGSYHWLGRIYGGTHEDYPENIKEAVKWLRLAAAAGDVQSQCGLGVHYHEGDGVRRNLKRAAELYRASAEQGDEWACYLLGLCYGDGEGVRKNRRWARHWIGKADLAGVKDAKRAMVALDE